MRMIDFKEYDYLIKRGGPIPEGPLHCNKCDECANKDSYYCHRCNDFDYFAVKIKKVEPPKTYVYTMNPYESPSNVMKQILNEHRYITEDVAEAAKKLADWPRRNPHIMRRFATPEIKKVIFNPPATVILWMDNSKTVVKAQNGEEFDPEKGMTMAICKKLFGNKGNYFNEIKKWTEPYYEENSPTVEFTCYTPGGDFIRKMVDQFKEGMNFTITPKNKPESDD